MSTRNFFLGDTLGCIMIHSFVVTVKQCCRPSITHGNSGYRYDCRLNGTGGDAAFTSQIFASETMSVNPEIIPARRRTYGRSMISSRVNIILPYYSTSLVSTRSESFH